MNARRVHEFMRQHFPPFSSVAHDWIIVADESGPRSSAIESLLAKFVRGDELIVEVHRRIGCAASRAEAASFIGGHIGQGQIRVTDRERSGFVVVEINGVGCGWLAAAA